MKKSKKKKLKNAGININENIRLAENVSYNSLLLDNFNAYSGYAVTSIAILEASVNELKDSADKMDELGETESLRLQMAMDRISRFMNTLSNIMKKINDTQEKMIQNLK